MPAKNTFQATAPARLDVMGGIADYSGSLVLQMPLQLSTMVSIQLRSDKIIHIQSNGQTCRFDAGAILQERGSILQKANWAKDEIAPWALYILGCVFVLLDYKDFAFRGMDIEVQSDVPIGKGISSSAALEVATLKALYQAFGLELEREPLAVYAQMAENIVAGAPCGIMDQMAVHLGQKNKLLPILCQPYLIEEVIPIPSDLQFYGLDTGVKHAVSGSAYSTVRAATFMGWSIILQSMGIDKVTIAKARAGVAVELPFEAYLANISVELFKKSFAKLLPKQMQGSEFLRYYGETTDPFTHIDPEKIYPVLASTQHPVYEHERISEFKKILLSDRPDKKRLGELMLASHHGYFDCGLSCPEADFIIDMVQQEVPGRQVFGARITGGGSGGTVGILASSLTDVQAIRQTYEQAFGVRTHLFAESSMGAYYR